MENQKLSSAICDLLDELDWSVAGYTDDGRVELEKYSPAGEDFIMCVSVENIVKDVMMYAEDFDVDEHITMWVEAKSNGTAGVPSIKELVYDADAIQEMLDNLAEALNTKMDAENTERDVILVFIRSEYVRDAQAFWMPKDFNSGEDDILDDDEKWSDVSGDVLIASFRNLSLKEAKEITQSRYADCSLDMFDFRAYGLQEENTPMLGA